jgi:pyruvyl transferase EpsI
MGIGKKIRAQIAFRIRYFRGMGKRKIILINTPTYGNLGDHAIVIAERRFFCTYFPKSYLCEINKDELINYFEIWEKIIQKQDALFIQGGGYLGDLWLDEEMMVRKILERFSENKLIVLPQTIYFREEQHRESSIEAYRHHKGKMLLFLRDQESYEFYQEHLKDYADGKLTPDMALSFKWTTNNPREGILCCFRNDQEKAMEPGLREMIQEWLDKQPEEVRYTNTCVPVENKSNYFETRVMEKMNEFSKAKLVITDRLHGMLFSAITGTPCICIDNISHKVSGGYEWLKGLSYVRMIRCAEELEEVFEALPVLMEQRNQFDYPYFEVFYKEMQKDIISFLDE